MLITDLIEDLYKCGPQEEIEFKVFDNEAIIEDFKQFCLEKELDLETGVRLLTENVEQ